MRALAIALAAVTASSCADRDPVVAPPAPARRTALLTIVASPVPGTTATHVKDITCPVRLHVAATPGRTISGTFERTGCTGLLNPTSDVQGTFEGTVAPDGSARLVFTPAPLSSSAAINTSGGCRIEEGASGPYEGRVSDSAIDVVARFRLYCAGLPSPAPPSFDVEYRITTF